MVTCTKCGTKNADDAQFCVNCGAALYSMDDKRKRGDSCFGQPNRGMESECFGLPHGATIIGLVIGLLIILFGLGNLFGWRVDFGPLILIIIGVLIVTGALYRYGRRR